MERAEEKRGRRRRSDGESWLSRRKKEEVKGKLRVDLNVVILLLYEKCFRIFLTDAIVPKGFVFTSENTSDNFYYDYTCLSCYTVPLDLLQ